MPGRLPLLGPVLLLGLVTLFARPDDRPAPASTPIEFLVNTTARPVHVRLHVEVDGLPLEKGFRSAHQEQLRALFPYLDRNGDGSLAEAEARGIPLPLIRLPGTDESDHVHVAHNFLAIDLDGDGKVTPAELTGYYEEFEGGAFLTRTPPQSVAASIAGGNLGFALFQHLDTNQDGELPRNEMLAAADRLRKLDTDGDDLVTVTEVLPLQGGRRGIPVEIQVEPGVQPGISPLDFTADRLRALQKLQPDLELRVRLGERKPDQPLLEVLRPGGQDPLVKKLRKGPGDVLLALEGVRLELRLDQSRLSERALAGLRDEAIRHFRSADTDGDGLVKEAEAKRNLFIRDLFPLLDRQGRGSIREPQLREYIDSVLSLQARTMSRRVSLVAAQGSLGLWDVLDRNRDGVLGLREVREAFALLGSLDSNGDGLVTREEVPTLYVLQLGVGQSDYRRLSGDHVVGFTPDGRLTYLSGAEGGGPLWFRKMDRNGDGDVSRREFLGPPASFKKLDLDGDDLISREEAEKSDAGRQNR